MQRTVKIFGLITIIMGLLNLASLGQQSQIIVIVRCESLSGCFKIISHAIATAPDNVILEISPGVYIEPLMIIDKSLTLRGTSQESTPGGLLERPIIRAMEPGPLFTIRAPRNSINVSIEGMELQSLMVNSKLDSTPPEFAPSVSLVVEGQKNGSVEQLKVSLRRSVIVASSAGIVLSGKAILNIRNSEIKALGVAISAGINLKSGSSEGGSQLKVEDSVILGIPQSGVGVGILGLGVVSLLGIDATLQNNRISYSLLIDSTIATRATQSTIGISAFSSLTSPGKYDFVGNEVTNLGMGFYLGGKIEVDMSRNTVSNNRTYGIALLLPSCFGNEVDKEQEFRGSITGSDNKLSKNAKGDLCPAMNVYPWPPGFVKQ